MVGAGEPGYSRVNRLLSASSITTQSRAAFGVTAPPTSLPFEQTPLSCRFSSVSLVQRHV